MISARVIDTHRLSIVANAAEREMVHFLNDLTSLTGAGDAPLDAAQRIRVEMVKAGFEEIRVGPGGNIAGRIGSGKCAVRMEVAAHTAGAAGMAGLVYAGKLINELGMYGDYTLWIARAAQSGIDESAHLPADCVVRAEPTGLCIHRGTRGRIEISERHRLVQAAIATYEALFELPPVIHAAAGLVSAAPSIAFGPGDHDLAPVAGEVAPFRQLVKASQFYAAFPVMYVDSAARR